MEWLNASVTFLNSPEMLRSKMEQRGVWLTLMKYCIQQENDGRMGAVADWDDWDFQTVLGVPKKLTKEDSLLWQWHDGGDLVVHGYPVEKQAEIQAKREAGKRGGLSSGQARAKQTASTASTTAPRTAATERKGKEGKEKEEERKDRGVGTLLSTWLGHASEAYPAWPEAEATAAWAHYDAIGWLNASGHPVVSWQSCVITCYSRWSKGPKKISDGGGGAAGAGFDPEKPHAHTGGLPVFEGAEVAS